MVPISYHTVSTQIFKSGLGILLAFFQNLQSLPKDTVNPKWQDNQKNSCGIEQTAPPNLKRSGFVFVNDNSKVIKELNTKQSVAVFLMSAGR